MAETEQDTARESAYQEWKQHHQIGTADAHAEPMYRTIWDAAWAAAVAHGRAAALAEISPGDQF